MKVTVVTVCRNCESFIETTIRSVVSQTYPSVEYIIIDGNSTDGTMAVVDRYRDQMAHIISEPDEGIYDAMNKGLRLATGEWIIFMNAGDVFYDDDVITNMHLEQLTNDKCGAVYGDYQGITHEGMVTVICDHPFYKKNKWQLLRDPQMGFHHQSVFVRTRLAKEHPFCTQYKYCADYHMILQVFKAGYELEYRPGYVCIVEGRDGLTAENRAYQFIEHYRVLHLSYHPIAIWYSLRALLHLLKTKLINANR